MKAYSRILPDILIYASPSGPTQPTRVLMSSPAICYLWRVFRKAKAPSIRELPVEQDSLMGGWLQQVALEVRLPTTGCHSVCPRVMLPLNLLSRA